MEYLLALPTDLGLSADEFTVSWNETPECQRLAEAQYVEPGDLPSEFIAGEVAALKTEEGVDKTELLEGVKQALLLQGIMEEVHLVDVEHPQGTPTYFLQMGG